MTKQTNVTKQAKPKKSRSRSTKKTSLLQGLHRRDIILLSGFLALACVGVMIVVFIALGRQSRQIQPISAEMGSDVPRPQPTHTVTFVQVTGLSQYRLAETAARTWAEDAQLVSASASWPQVLSADEVGSPAEWNYRFYSPSKELLLFAFVDVDGTVNTVEHIEKVTLIPATIDTDAWAIDSPAALATWLDNGGAELLRTNPGLEVLVQLRTVSSSPSPVWAVVGADDRTEDLLIVVVDANQGMVTTTSPES